MTAELESNERGGILPLCMLVAISITALIVALHLFFLFHAGGFWRDEVNLINLAASHSLNDMKKDSFPILMPVLVRSWSALGLGRTDLGLRCLGTLIGFGITTALWLITWKTRRASPLLSLLLFGLNSTLIVFGDSIRAYGLGCLLIMLTVAAAIAFLQRPSWWRTGGMILFATLSVQTLYHNAILVGAICLGACIVCWRQKKWTAMGQIALTGLVAALSLLPYVSVVAAGRESSEILRTGFRSWRFIAAFRDAFGFPIAGYFYVWAILVSALIFTAGMACRRTIKNSTVRGDDLSLFAGITVLFAGAGYVLFLWLSGFPSQSWYVLPLMALTVVCVEVGLPSWRGKMRVLFFGLCAATALLAIPKVSRDLQNRFTNVDTWAKELTARTSPDDYIVVVPWIYGITFDYYFKGSTAWTTLPPLSDHTTHRYDLVRAQIQNTNAIQPVLERIATTLQSGHRVLILAAMGWMDISAPQTAALSSLPPAPLKNSGWSEAPYTVVWDSQISHLLADHSLQFARVKNPDAGKRFIENTELFMAEGWKNSAAPGNSNPTKP